MQQPACLIDSPSQLGQITNHFGSNASTDDIPVTVRFRGVASEAPSGIRYSIQRTQLMGAVETQAESISDSFWVGTPSASPLPNPATPSGYSAGAYMAPHSCEAYNGRLYAIISQPAVAPSQFTGPITIAYVASAPIQGGNVGSWRMEQPVQATLDDPWDNPYWINDSTLFASMVRLDNFLYVIGQNGIYYSQIQADTTLSAWQLALWGSYGGAYLGPGSSAVAIQNLQPSDTLGWIIVHYGFAPGFGGGFSPMNTFAFNSDGSATGGLNATPVVESGTGAPTVGYGVIHLDPYGTPIYVGGENASGVPQTTVYKNVGYSIATGSGGTWSSVANAALPVALSRFGHAFWYTVPEPSGNPTDSYIYIVGGKNTSSVATNKIYRALTSQLRSGASSPWTTYSNNLNTSRYCCGAALSISNESPNTQAPIGTPPQTPEWQPQWSGSFTGMAYDSAAANNTQAWPRLFVLGGIGANLATEIANAWDTTRPVNAGGGSALTTTLLGGSSSISQNADGTYEVTFCLADYSQGGLGRPKAVSALNNGDVVQVGISLASSLTGDTSAPVYTAIKVAQGPTATIGSPPTNNGLPTISLTYAPGSGGAGEQEWQITVKRHSDQLLVYYSGLVRGQANTSQVYCAPALVSGTEYDITATVYSKDNPLPGFYNYDVVTQSFTPSLGTVPSTPTSVSATADDTNGRIILKWTNPTGGTAVSYNRIYYRETGNSTWTLLVDNYTPLAQGSQNTVYLSDYKRLFISYDLCVASVSANNVEGAQSTTVSATLVPDVAGYQTGVRFLQTAGHIDGTTIVAPCTMTGDPAWLASFATVPGQGGSINAGAISVPILNAALPIRRYSPLNNRSGTVNITCETDAQFAALQAVIAAGLQGQLLRYRDALASMTVVIGDQNQLAWDAGNRECQLQLFQAADTLRPYVPMGAYAIGIPTMEYGNIPPYNSVEVP